LRHQKPPASPSRDVAMTDAMTPRGRIEAECGRRGKKEVVAACIALLAGRHADPHLIVALGGPPASWAVTGGASGPDYWLRVWAARGLLWAWEDRAEPAILRALNDDAWRVREAAIRVVARHRVTQALPRLAALAGDENRRVRSAAARAAARLSEQP
jgi:HEAT repeat protein